MQLKDMFIHPFRTRDKYYIYDVNTNCILKVTKNVYDWLVNKENMKLEMCDFPGEIKDIINNGFLSSKRVNEIEHPISKVLPFMLKNRLNFITLQVTQQCNLRCSYCAYSGAYNNRVHEEKSMDIDLAMKGIDFIINNSSEAPSLTIGFYGGEPLLQLNLIKECVQYAKKQSEGKELYFSMTTNGTLLDDKTVDFLAENKFILIISIDGSQEVHDKNRKFAANGKGTFNAIMKNVARLRDRYPEYADKNVRFNAVLDGTNDFNCSNDFFTNYETIKEFIANISLINSNYAKDYIEPEEKFFMQLGYEKFKLLLNKVNRLDEKYVSKLIQRDFVVLKESIYKRHIQKELFEIEHPSGPCVVGIRKLFMNVDGVFYPCEKVSELSGATRIGDINNGFNLEKMDKLLNIGKMSTELCKNCWAYRYCSFCAATVDGDDELSAKDKVSKCQQVRYSADAKLKDFCTLMEFECDFED